MSPILQALVTLALCILLRLFLLRQMPLAVCSNAAHVGNVVFVIARRVFLWVLAEDVDDLAAAVSIDPVGQMAGFGRWKTREREIRVRMELKYNFKLKYSDLAYLSCPIVSPEPSDLDQPEL